MRFAIEQMRAEHIPAISAIDRVVYPVPWPVHSYRSELHNRTAYYIVAEGRPSPLVSKRLSMINL